MSTPDLPDLRGHWTLHSDVTLLNHGSFGACPRAVLDVQAELRAEIEREPVRFLGRELEPRLDAVRERLGPFLGAAPEDLAFVPNATTGVNAVLGWLALEPGDEVLITDHGYNACNNAVEHVCARAGARRTVAKLPFPLRSSDEALEAILAAVTPRTRLVLVDHVTSPSALVLPVERLVPALRERGVETLIDGAHAPGQVALDLDALGAGYVTGNAHKWLCAPKQAAYLWVRRDLQPRVRPTTISHGANDRRTARSRFRIEFDWPGTFDPTPVLAIPAALDFLEGLFPGGIAELRERNHALALAGRDVLLDALGADAPTPDDMLGAMATVPLPDADPVELPSAFDTLPLKDRLFDEHRIEVPLFAWPAPEKRAVRISAQAYNRIEDYRRLAEALRTELAAR
jgi:isopenicillin-N epimerase